MDKKKIAKVLPFVLVTIALIGFISYALLTIDLEGMKISGVTRPNVSISLDEAKSINLTLSEMSDANGKTQTNYSEFTVSSKGKWDGTIPVNVYMKEINKGIDNSNIKVYLTKVVSGSETQVLAPTAVSALTPYKEDTNSYILNKGSYAFTSTEEKTYTDTYRLRVWVKEGATIANPGYTTTNESDGSISATTNDIKYSFKINVSTKKIETGAESLIAKVGTGGLVADTHPVTEQLQATTDYRYTGANPNNYVTFNNESWRIVGVFDVDDGTGNLEKRMKIIGFPIENVSSWSENGDNDWTTSSTMNTLNSGDYWNRTGPYSSNGLTETAKSMINDAVWYLGGALSTDNTKTFYELERQSEEYEGKIVSWTGKVGLISVSDYGYATSGYDEEYNRIYCLEAGLDSNYYESSCAVNNWLNHNDEYAYFSITREANSGINVYDLIDGIGLVEANVPQGQGSAIVPTVYLSSDIQITGGTGTSTDPYTLSK